MKIIYIYLLINIIFGMTHFCLLNYSFFYLNNMCEIFQYIHIYVETL